MNKATKALLWLLVLLGGVAHAGTVHYYYTDPQGTVLAKADAQGAIVARYDYAPYGTSAPNLDAAPAGPGYTGHVNDPDTGLVYMQARYYDPVVGRFLSVDPVGPAVGNPYNFNRFAYANNNPIVNMDPDGRCVGSLFCDDTPGTVGKPPVTFVAPSASEGGTNKGGKVTMTDKERSALSTMSYRDSKMKNAPGENYLFMDQNGKVLGMSNKGCEGSGECTVDPDSAPAGTAVLGHDHIYPNVNGVFQNRRANEYREFPGPGDANPLVNGWLSAIFTPSGARYVVDGSISSPQLHYLGGGNAAFGNFVVQKWHPNITPDEIAADLEAFHKANH